MTYIEIEGARRRARQWMLRNKGNLPGPLSDNDFEQLVNLLADFLLSQLP